MTSTAPARRNDNGNALAGLQLPHSAPDRVGQGTAIEQSRAAAEVYASVLAAKQCPRDQQNAIRLMEQSCRMTALAERAFFRYSRGGGQITGASVHLARELARCWGNIQYGVSELRRDDEHAQSEMQAFAWDLESNARAASVFIVPHKRDKRGGPEVLTDMRDIYESNANAGARRVREAIFSVLPFWYVEQGKDLCRSTLENGGDKPLPQRIADILKAFERLGVSEQRLALKIGLPSDKWTGADLATLTVIGKSISNGEATVDQEFPTNPVTVDEITSRKGRTSVRATTAAPQAEQPAPTSDEDAEAEWAREAQQGEE